MYKCDAFFLSVRHIKKMENLVKVEKLALTAQGRKRRWHKIDQKDPKTTDRQMVKTVIMLPANSLEVAV